ncbi:glycosyltransferase family 2 protein [Candidatus Woesearchaeota archaeon]|jgi:glycosyltransferase involved in cell wall biosynthesis|nr:glycosyltransferase family 2 protein [Candidatus Woesearchaeota archaeon]MBT5342139.1 glycosyltransferase family 2 protein [Candidatus Woesearchaeota archaeon]
MKIIISIPAYNEEKTLPRVLEEIKEVMSNTNYKYEFLILNDGSKDRTKEVAEKDGAIVVSNRRNLGLAETFKKEMQECLKRKADIIVHTDADGQYHPQHIPEMIEKVKSGYELVLGSRFKRNIKHMPFLKKIGNLAFAKVISSLTKVKITDSTTGYRAFTAEVARDINYINTFTYTQEQIIKAAKQGFKICEVPIVCRKTRESRLFNNPFQYAIKAWINIFRIYRDYQPLKFFGQIGGIFFLLGFLLGIYITITFILTGVVGGIPRVILSMLLMLTGIQIILFGFFADMLHK